MALDILLPKINTEQQALSYLGPKIPTKISHSTENVGNCVGKQVSPNLKQTL